MKKRFISIILITIMLSGAVLPMAVSAAVPWYHTESLRFGELNPKILHISMDVKRTDELLHMFTLSSPKDVNDPYNTATWLNWFSVVMTAEGDLRANANGAWLSTETEGVSIGTLPVDNKWHNIRFKIIKDARSADMYLDGEFIYSFDYGTRIPLTMEIEPCNLITFSGDSTDKGSVGYEAKILYAIGIDEGELGLTLSEHNQEEKKLTLSYTDKLSEELTGAILKKTDVLEGETEIPLYIASSSDYETVFRYDELEATKEYALILPDDLKGKNGEEPKATMLYFINPGESSMVNIKYSDYTTYDTEKDVKLGKGTEYELRRLNDKNCGAYAVFAWQGDYAGGAQLWKTTANWGEEDSYLIPTGSKVSEISFDIIPKRADMSYGFCLTHNLRNNISKANGIEISFDEAGNIIADTGVVSYGWSTLWSQDWASKVIGKYEVDVPVNIKYVLDKPEKKVYLYLNGELKKTVDETGANASKLYSAETSYLTLYEMFGHEGKNIYGDRETLFFLDNVRLDVLKEVYAQPEVRFYEVGGSEKGAYDEISRKIDKITVDFGREIDADSLGASTLSVYYDGVLLDYTADDAVYDEDSFTYTICPAFVPGKGNTIEVLCNGVVDGEGNAVEAFKVYAEAGNQDGISVDDLYTVDADGNKISEIGGEMYASALITNIEDTDRSVLISFMGYKGDVLKKLELINATVEKGAKYTVGCPENILGMDTAELDRIEVSVQDAVSGSKICDSFVLGELENDGENTYSGKGAVPYDDILAEVYAPEKGIENLGDTSDFRDIIIFKATTKADENGDFKITFDVEYEDVVSGMCNVFIHGTDYEDTDKLLYVNPVTAKNVLENSLIPAISSGNTAEAARILNENRYDLYIDDKYIDENVAQKAAELLIEYEKERYITSQNAKTVLNKAVAISAFELGKIADIIGEAGIFNLDESDIAEFYGESYVNDVTKADIAARLDDIAFTSMESFDEELRDAFVLAVTSNPVEPKSAMTVMKALGLSGYTAAQYNYVSGKSYESIAKLKAALEAYQASGSGSSSVSGGGGGGSASVGNVQNIVIAPTGNEDKAEDNSEPSYAAGFKDISSVPWAEEAILHLADIGVINGKADGIFAPNDTVTREEFTKMIVISLAIKGETGVCGFADVSRNEWYTDYIDAAYSAGLIKGYSSDIFGIGECITREDMAVILCRGAEKAGIQLGGNASNTFADNQSISQYARNSVYKLKNAGIVNGKDGNLFTPKAFATRAEAAKMIYNLIAE